MTNSNHSKNSEESHAQNAPRAFEDTQWEEFINTHADDLHSVEASRTAKKFEKKALKAEEKAQAKAQRKLRIEDFDDSVFANPSGVTRGYSVSWLDADEVDNHHHAPNPAWSSKYVSSTLAVLLVILGFICLAVAVAFPAIGQICGGLSGILILLGFAIFGVSRSRHRS